MDAMDATRDDGDAKKVDQEHAASEQMEEPKLTTEHMEMSDAACQPPRRNRQGSKCSKRQRLCEMIGCTEAMHSKTCNYTIMQDI